MTLFTRLALPQATAGVVLAAAVMAIAGTTPASAQSVAAVANMTGADRQAKLEAGAKKEGSVLYYTVGTQTAPMMKRFREKYPFIKLEVSRANSTNLVRRTLEENKAGHHVVDAFGSSVGGLRPIRDAGILQPFKSPHADAYKKAAFEKDGHWMVDYASHLSFAWNTKEIPEAASIKTYEDLLDPRWKGKMTISGWTSTAARWLGVLIQEKGEKFVSKLGKQDIRVYQASPKAIANLIVSGEAPMSPIIYSSHIANSKGKGASVEWKALGTTFANNGGVAIAKKAPHPHAAMLLIDFMVSLEGQKMRQPLGYITYRKDLTNPPGQPEHTIDITERATYLRDHEKWARMIETTFGKGKKLPKKKKK